MGTTKNSQGLSAAVEFIQDPRFDLDALEEMQILNPGFEFPLDPTTGITLLDILEAPPEDVPDVFSDRNTRQSSILNSTDLFRCDPNTRDLIPIDCSTCAKNPSAAVPDWRELVTDSIFFDQRRCTYSVVLDTGIEGIPSSDFIIELLKTRGLKLILEDLKKVETFTTVTYEPRNQLNDSQIEASDVAVQTGVALAATGVLMPFGIGLILAGVGLAALQTPGKKNGFKRILSEYDTIPTLLGTTIQDPIIAGSDSNAAVVIEYYVPTTPGVPSRALVSVDSAVIENVPRIVDSQPTADFSGLEVTISGEDYGKIFKDVARNLRRSNTFAANAQRADNLNVYPTSGSDTDRNRAMVLDFANQGNELRRFQDEVLSPAIYAVLGIRLSQLEKVIIELEEVDGTKLRIKEVSANRYGCELVKFSEFRSKREVKDLFNFKRTTTLGYVVQLPNMMADLLGQADIVWLDWLTRYTYPGIEFKSANPYGLNLPGIDDKNALQCIAEQSVDQLVNSILNSVLAAGNLFINSISAELCPPEDVALLEEQEFRKARKDLRKKIRNANGDAQEAFKEDLDKLTTDKRAETRAKFQKYMRANLNTERYLKNQPLARILALNIVYGVDHMASKDAKEGSLAQQAQAKGLSGPLLIPPQPKIFGGDNLQEALDATLGGWCGWVALTLEALQCVAKGMGINDYRESIVRAALGKMTPWQFQKLFSRMSPEIRDRIRQAMVRAVGTGDPNSPSILFPWENEFNESHTYDQRSIINEVVEELETRRLRDEGLLPPEAAEAASEADSGTVEQADDVVVVGAPNRQTTAAGPWSAALGRLQSDLTGIFVDAVIDAAGFDTLFELLDDFPGFAIIEKLIDEKPCLLPKLPFVNPPLDSFLKTLNIEICNRDKDGGNADLTLPRFVGIPSGTRNIFHIISQKGNEILLAIAAQLLVQTLTTVIQSTLDAACNILALGGASLADAINGNTEFMDKLKGALCPPDQTLTGNPLSDEDFNQAMLNILDALTNGDSDRDCVKEITPQIMGQFIDAIMVALTYQQLFQLVLGRPTPQTLDIITAIANNLGHECLAIIFGDPNNVLNYFKTLGDLIDAEGIFEDFPEGGIPNTSVGICPPEVLDYVNELRANLLSDKGLTSEEIQQQLDFLAEQAKKNLEDILEGLEEGPYAGLPAIQSDGTCPDDGIYNDFDYAMDTAFDINLNGIFKPIEQSQMRDLVGVDGVFNNVLSDTNGRRLRAHRFLAGGFFGNSVGATNFLFQFYSDDSLRVTEVVDEDNQDEDESKVQEYIDNQQKKRIDQFGNRLDTNFGGSVAPLALGEPHGGFPPTVAAMLMRKFKKGTLGRASGARPDDADLLKFESKTVSQQDIDNYEVKLLERDRIVAKRQQLIAKWAAATGYVGYQTLKNYLFELDSQGDIQFEKVLTTDPNTGKQIYTDQPKLLQLSQKTIECIDAFAKLRGNVEGVPATAGTQSTLEYSPIATLETRRVFFNDFVEKAATTPVYSAPDPTKIISDISGENIILEAFISPDDLRVAAQPQGVGYSVNGEPTPYTSKQVQTDGRYGIAFSVYETLKGLIDSDYARIIGDTANADLTYRQRDIFESAADPESVVIDVYDMKGNASIFVKRPMTLELVKLYVDIAEQQPVDSGYIVPSIPEPTDLGMTYVTYGYANGLMGGGNTIIGSPHWGFDLNYNVNPQNVSIDETGRLTDVSLETEPFRYNVRYIEIINPFNDPNLTNPPSLKDIIKEQRNLSKSDVNLLEVAPPISRGLQRQRIVYFDKNITSPPSVEVQNYLNYLIDVDKVRPGARPYESEYLLRMLNQNIAKDFDSLRTSGLGTNFIVNDANRELSNTLFEFVNEGFVRRISDFIGRGDGSSKLLIADKKGQTKKNAKKQNKQNAEKNKEISCPEGFKFGFDLYKEPEIDVLDYRIYGGTAENPPFYIKPPKYEGWMGLLGTMLPEQDGCEPARIPIYNLDQVKRKSKELYGKLKEDKRLSMVPTCTQEAPYDSIYNRSTVANMDAMIRAIARVNALDFVLKAVPIFSQFEINFDKNFDQLLSIYLSEYTLQKILIADEKGRSALVNEILLGRGNEPIVSDVKRRVNEYYYGVLEQTGYLIAKRIEAGDLELEDLGPAQQEAFMQIAETVDQYYKDFDGTLGILSEEAIQIQNIFKKVFNKAATRNVSSAALGRGSESFSKKEAKRVKTGLLYAVLRDTEEQASTLFSRYLEEEIQSLAPVLKDVFNPPVDSMDLLFMSHPDWINGSVAQGFNESAVSAASKVLDLTGDQGPYHVMSNPDNPNKFNITLGRFSDGGALFRPDEDRPETGRWPFVLEMYATIENKEADQFEDPTLVDVFNRRAANMPNNGVINLLDLQKYIDDLTANTNYDLFGNVSDYFGPKIFETDDDPTSSTYGEQIVKNTGIKFGLRLSMCFDSNDPRAKMFRSVSAEASESVRMKTKAYNLKRPQQPNLQNPQNPLQAGTEILIPLASGELPVRDQPLTSLNIDQYDLICLINELIKQTEFKTLFEYIFPYRRYLSLFTIYTANSFYESIGNVGRPDQGGDRWAMPGGRRGTGFRRWDKTGFESTNNMLKKSFLALYRTKNPVSDIGDRDQKDQATTLKDLLAPLFPDNLLDGMPWWQKRMRRKRPYDAFGNVCDTEDDI